LFPNTGTYIFVYISGCGTGGAHIYIRWWALRETLFAAAAAAGVPVRAHETADVVVVAAIL
jgi:hypothetical protein